MNEFGQFIEGCGYEINENYESTGYTLKKDESVL
jgi:hypothetical protein